MPTAVHAIFKLPDGGASIPIYTSTKAAVTDAARSLAGAYGDQNIRAYSVNPALAAWPTSWAAPAATFTSP